MISFRIDLRDASRVCDLVEFLCFLRFVMDFRVYVGVGLGTGAIEVFFFFWIVNDERRNCKDDESYELLGHVCLH